MYRLKHIIFALVLSSGTVFSFAQTRTFGTPNLIRYDDRVCHFGFLIGAGSYNYIIATNPDLTTNADYDTTRIVNTKAGKMMCLGIVSDLHLGKYFDLRLIPTFSFPDCQINYMRRTNSVDRQFANGNANGIVFIDLPLMLKFKSSRIMNNLRVYVLGGAQYSRNLVYGKAEKLAYQKNVLLVTANDVAALTGIGLDFYCTYFKLSTELKFSVGLLNQLQQEGVSKGSIQSLRSKSFQFSVTFE